jgi:hypothetical protein
MSADASRRAWLLAAALIVLPAACVVAFMIWGKLDTSLPRSELVVMERWENNQPKTLLREWTEGELIMTEQCGSNETGELIGCCIMRDNEPFSGVCVDWFRPGAPGFGRLRMTREYADGKANGLWRTYDPDGTLTSETRFEKGRRIDP